MNQIPRQLSGKESISLFFIAFTIYLLACPILNVIGGVNIKIVPHKHSK